MRDFPEVQWQPVDQLGLLAEMVDGLLEETRAFHTTLSAAWQRPHVLDDETLDRADEQYREHAYWLDVYAEQFRRWHTLALADAQRQEIERLFQEVEAIRPVVRQVQDLTFELRSQTIDRVLELSDAELGLATLLGIRPGDLKKRR